MKTQEKIAIMQAYLDGKTIEYKAVEEDSDKWEVVKKPSWEWMSFDYRVKPEPRYRPFESATECWTEMMKHQPFGWIKALYGNDFENITYVDDNGIVSGCGSTETPLMFKPFIYYMGEFEYEFIDGTPFGVKEE